MHSTAHTYMNAAVGKSGEADVFEYPAYPDYLHAQAEDSNYNDNACERAAPGRGASGAGGSHHQSIEFPLDLGAPAPAPCQALEIILSALPKRFWKPKSMLKLAPGCRAPRGH